jgi:uncharacterized membrane protein
MTLTDLGVAHFAAAVVGLVLGAIALVSRKGTPQHRLTGMCFVVAMVTLNGTALGIYRLTGAFGPFHALALMSLVSLLFGIVPALRRRPGWLIAHFKGMSFSYLGLVAAASAELVVRAGLLGSFARTPERIIAVGVAIAIVFTVLGLVLVPRLERAALNVRGAQ